jgi:DNA-binding MarR family transcriptional regulator
MPKTRTSPPRPPKIGDEHLAAWRAFLRAHSTMLRRISRDLEEADLPPLGWYDVLASLHEAPSKQLRQVELAEQVLLSHSGLSRLLDRMEKAQVVERRSCATDRRSFYIGVTSEGERLLGQMWPVYARGVAEDFLPALGSNPCEITQTLEAIGSECDAERERQAEAGA